MRINGETHYLWRAIDHEGEVLEVFVTRKRDRKAVLRFLRRAMKRYGRPGAIVTDKHRSTITSTRNVIFAVAKTSNLTDRLHLPSGVKSRLEVYRLWDCAGLSAFP